MTIAIAKSVKCRYVKSTNTIKSSNFEMNLSNLDARSYGWWLFCTKVAGLVIFNNSMYSNSTCKHQGKVLKVLDYKTDLTLRFTRGSLELHTIKETLNSEIEGTRYEIRKLIKAIKKPRSWKSTNIERKQTIGDLLKHIIKVQSTKKAVL